MVAGINELNNLITKHGESADSLLICDYDGTLAPFREDRMEAFPYAGVEQALEDIRKNGTAISFVTGRPIEELLTLLPMAEEFDLWGSHGMEHKPPSGDIEYFPIDPKIDSVLEGAESWIRTAGWGDRLDKKHGSLAFHWRGSDSESILHMRHIVTEIWSKLISSMPIELREFDGGLELRVSGRDKGSAVRYLIRHARKKSAIAYLGDDFTDEDGFRAINGQGYSILVRQEWRPTSAEYWIKPPEELLSFLENWKKHLY